MFFVPCLRDVHHEFGDPANAEVAFGVPQEQ
jgi:hypothetical protein